MVNSMTGFAAQIGSHALARWGWEIRSVNARGLDIRLRLPDGMDAVERALRKALQARCTRGNISVTLRLQYETTAGTGRLDRAALAAALLAVKEVEQQAEALDVHLTASRAADILSMRGVIDVAGHDSNDDNAALIGALIGGLDDLVADFAQSRAAEGGALGAILSAQIGEIEALVTAATGVLGDRAARMADGLKTNLARILDNSEGADADRVAQELAMIAVKADVAEELDRLSTHIVAARDLLTTKGAIGRKFDFLTQEFNREANTLCSKSGSGALTRIGLDLKTVIDQMREQVQNVE